MGWKPFGLLGWNPFKKGKRKPKPPVFFGTSLDKFEEVPDILRQICEHIYETSADVEGLFQLPGKDSDVEKICKLYETQPVVDLNDPKLNDPHTLCSVIMKFFRKLKGGIVSQETILKLVFIANEFPNDTDERLKLYCKVLSSLPMTNRITLIYFLDFLHNYAKRQEVNKMTAENLATSIGPSLFRVEYKKPAYGDPSGFRAAIKAMELYIKCKKDVNDMLAQMIEDAPKLKRKFGFRFGAPIYEFNQVPDIISDICFHVVCRSVEVKNILTKSGRKQCVRKIRELYEKQSFVDLDDPDINPDPYAAPTVLKEFLRELKGGVVNEETTLSIVRITEKFPYDFEKRWKRIYDALRRLPKNNRRVLIRLVNFLNDVNTSRAVNGMGELAERTSAGFGGIIFRFPDTKDKKKAMERSRIVNAVLAHMVENPRELQIIMQQWRVRKF